MIKQPPNTKKILKGTQILNVKKKLYSTFSFTCLTIGTSYNNIIHIKRANKAPFLILDK